MKSNPESDGEYTDAEHDAGEPAAHEVAVNPTEIEGEYTDADTPNEANPQGT